LTTFLVEVRSTRRSLARVRHRHQGARDACGEKPQSAQKHTLLLHDLQKTVKTGDAYSSFQQLRCRLHLRGDLAQSTAADLNTSVRIDVGRMGIGHIRSAQMSKRAQPLLWKQMRLELSHI
jgi:hypothetical protein